MARKLGNLLVYAGQPDEATAAYNQALATVPNHAAAIAGLGRQAVGRGDLDEAIRRFQQASAILPLPEYVIALGEYEQAAGRHAAARRDLALARAEQRLLSAAGVNTDAEAAVFEADHGSPAHAVRLGRRAWAAAPSVRSADALGWALTRAGRPAAGLRWAHRALALGSRDPAFLAHAGVTARAAGRPAEAAPLLAAARRSPGLSPVLAREVGR